MTESGEETRQVKVFGRPTVGGCKCLSQSDCHKHLLWNLGNGVFLSYELLMLTSHQFFKGLPLNAQAMARAEVARGKGKISNLKVSDLTRGMIGFCAQMKSLPTDWRCFADTCGQTPSYLGKTFFSYIFLMVSLVVVFVVVTIVVCVVVIAIFSVMDGKCVAPSSDSVKDVCELGVAPWDERVICQGSTHRDRVFLYKKKDRKLVTKLCSQKISSQDFLNENTSSPNMIIVKKLVEFLRSKHGDQIPGKR